MKVPFKNVCFSVKHNDKHEAGVLLLLAGICLVHSHIEYCSIPDPNNPASKQLGSSRSTHPFIPRDLSNEY